MTEPTLAPLLILESEDFACYAKFDDLVREIAAQRAARAEDAATIARLKGELDAECAARKKQNMAVVELTAQMSFIRATDTTDTCESARAVLVARANSAFDRAIAYVEAWQMAINVGRELVKAISDGLRALRDCRNAGDLSEPVPQGGADKSDNSGSLEQAHAGSPAEMRDGAAMVRAAVTP